MFDLEQVIRELHSTRLFLPRPVPRALVDEALVLAQHAPSNSDIQPWHMVFASGPPRDRLVKALLEEARRRPPNIPPLPEAFRHYRSELGAQVYGAMGIAREDRAGHDAAVLRNWEFLRAPLAGIVCMHRDLGLADALGVGMYLQTMRRIRSLSRRNRSGVGGARGGRRSQRACPGSGSSTSYPPKNCPARTAEARVPRSARKSASSLSTSRRRCW